MDRLGTGERDVHDLLVSGQTQPDARASHHMASIYLDERAENTFLNNADVVAEAT